MRRESAAYQPGNAALRASLPIEGMTCASCVVHVEEALRNAPGVRSASVNLAAERAEILLSDPADLGKAAAAVEGAGYAVPRESTDLRVEGMTCASCVSHVEQALQGVPGVTSASVNLATEQARVEHVAGLPVAALQKSVRDAGYEAQILSPAARETDLPERRAAAQNRLRRDVIAAALLTVPIVVLEMGSHLLPTFHMWVMDLLGRRGSWYVQFALTTLVLFGPGFRFFQKGVPALARATPDMNSLVAIGTAAAYGYSVVATFAPGLLPPGTDTVYYEAAAVIVTLVLAGRFLEARAKGRTSDAIRRLTQLTPPTAIVLRDNKRLEIPAGEVVVGDILEVRPGQRIPVDGVVVAGGSLVDQSMITGEPLPAWKESGSEVVGGTLNQSGAFSFRATKVGADTMLAHIVRTVEEAQGTKVPIQALADKVTGWFVPAVLAAATLTFLVWLMVGPEPSLGFALVNAVAVLIIACPCALGLATPISIMVATGRAAELGILFRSGAALQSLATTGIVALDKTGTVTSGKPALTTVAALAPFSENEVLSLVASVEAKSEHPIAAAIVRGAEERGLSLLPSERFDSRAGFGASAVVSGRTVEIGAERLMRELGVDVSPFLAAAAGLAETGATPLYAAVDRKLAGMLAVRDTVKPTSFEAIAQLRRDGIEVAMVTGDDGRAAEAIAREVGVSQVFAELSPTGKVEAVKRLRGSGRTVAFVGDGINDSPALAEADVGLAIGTGTDIAMESAEVVLVSGDLQGVPEAIALSKVTMRNIRQNLFWAFAYNVALIPVAACVLYPLTGTLLSPMAAAAAMALSSVFVVSNALRLRAFSGRRGRRPSPKLTDAGFTKPAATVFPEG